MPSKFYKGEHGLIALLIGIAAMALASTLAFSAVFVSLNRAESAKNMKLSYQSFYASESGAEDILLRYYSSKSLPTSYPSLLQVGSAIASTTLTTDYIGNGIITAQGDSQSRLRTSRLYITPSDEGSMRYAVQIGEGGLEMEANSTVIGTVYSNGNITGESGSEIQGDAAAVGTISSPSPNVTGAKTEGAQLQNLPQVDAEYWKARANVNNDPITDDHEIKGKSNTLGPRKIEGDLTVKSGAELTITGPLHVTGELEIGSDADIFIDESFAASTTVIVVEDKIEFDSNSAVHSTTASPKGFLMFLSESTSDEAIELSSNQLIDAAVYAPSGTVDISSNAEVTSIAGHTIHLGSNAQIEYNFGLQDVSFSSDPKGAEIISWQEQ